MAHDSSFFQVYTSATGVYSCGEIFVGSNPTLLIPSFFGVFLLLVGKSLDSNFLAKVNLSRFSSIF